VETVVTKEGIGKAAPCLHPEVVREQIREGVQKALANLTKYKPYKLKPPYQLVLRLKNEELVHEKSFYPGIRRAGDWELTYESGDLLEIMKAFARMH
jgi:D-amino peptidase